MEFSSNLKEAFSKVKEDIDFLNNELLNIKLTMEDLHVILKNLTKKLENKEKNTQTDRQTLRHSNQTHTVNSTDTSTVPLEVEGLKSSNLPISIGNEGVSTDRQTDTSTDTSTLIYAKNKEKTIDSDIREATEILNSLDSLKKEIRLKFKPARKKLNSF